MRFLILSTLLLASLAASQAQNVEIEKQRLIKFPDDFDPSERQPSDTLPKPDKVDEAKRILEQIAKVNEQFGYVKKQPEKPKLPPILDSSQYLFPKPAYQPFHAQQHHFPGSNGQTLLEPSIRAVKLTRDGLLAYNVPPKVGNPAKSESKKEKPPQLYYRPSQVLVPAPSSPEEVKQLPAHFAIPVHLYKLNKEQYLREHAPQEYRVKGYKIIGDVDSFYGKAKSISQRGKNTPKYHLFFLPRELALNEDGTLKNGPSNSNSTTTKAPPPSTSPPPTISSAKEKESRLEDSNNREKLSGRPYRVQASASSNSAQDAHSQHINTQAQLQSNRKRIKPLRNKETQVNAMAQQSLAGGGVATLSSNIRITPAPSHAVNAQSQAQTATASASQTNANPNLSPNLNGGVEQLMPTRNRLNPFRVTNINLADMQNQTSTAIKNAFQNIFKFPFRPATADQQAVTAASPAVMESVPLQSPHQALAHPGPMQPFYTIGAQQYDYKWDDDQEGAGDGSNSSANEDDTIEQVDNNAAEIDSSMSAEKHLFAHKAQHLMHSVGALATAHHGTQKQALREGGIIIQRLKVRKGGIAIAGPGGVATAGSGGTAIVGPGGYALTHPRSLTIAGPGAKVIAIPADVDLKNALQRTNLEAKSFPREGKVVATGPTVYYAPPTGTDYGLEEEEEPQFQGPPHWRLASYETWPLRQTPLLTYAAPAPAPAAAAAPTPEKLQVAAQSQTQPEEAKEQPVLPIGAFYQAPAKLLLLNSPYFAAYSLPLAYVAPSNVQAELATTTTTVKPAAGEKEDEEIRKLEMEIETLQKLQAAESQSQDTNPAAGDLKNDVRLRAAIGKINPNYVIEEIVTVPGKHVISSTSLQRLRIENQRLLARQAQPAKLRKAGKKVRVVPPVKVEATGRTRTSGNVPQIPFGTYFLPYHSDQAQAINGRKQAALILEPHSKAVVGNGGTAISTPISKALLKKGVPTNVYFNPESVAIAGVGGKAHAAADLELDLHRAFSPIIFEEFPYYGGLRGQSLQLRGDNDGSVRSYILNSQQHRAQPRDSDDTISIAAASISATADDDGSSSISGDATVGHLPASLPHDFNKIQLAAARLVAIQEMAKRKGSFSDEDNKIYASSLLELGQAAQNLALLQQTGQIKDFSVLLQPELLGGPQKKPSNLGLEANNVADHKIDEQKIEEPVTEQHFGPGDFLPPNNEDPYEDVNDSVAIMAPKKDAAVAEAKPVGLSIAGEGGVASSKPNAVALSGRNGLAVASPKATAIAGVSPEEAAAFSISLPSRNQLVIKSPNLAADKTTNDDYDYSDIPAVNFPPSRESPARPRLPVHFEGSDALVQKWRTAIAEEYAARKADKPLIRAPIKRRLHSE
ncbi:uncharacterized protein LOC115632719 [Scaptodrosophila lebanonensis]|uniref:Uncharacterized protein LOC115632719 n=1 Tax=Drosophila lebanonensis TaxID=7225 RepID=A0A6J2UBT3_DROLE|nr:uncharacterized protein LOC115632719 [Scaptodrosophila lebanonensis]